MESQRELTFLNNDQRDNIYPISLHFDEELIKKYKDNPKAFKKFQKEVSDLWRNTESHLFHDTVPLPEEQLPKARETAAKQNGIILDFFRERFSMSFTPAEVHSFLVGESVQKGHKGLILLTSVRRSITNLTKEGRLIKCQWSESKRGRYGKLNRVWHYNNEFINRLNPQKL